jgi:hypothetical protein
LPQLAVGQSRARPEEKEGREEVPKAVVTRQSVSSVAKEAILLEIAGSCGCWSSERTKMEESAAQPIGERWL